MSAIPNYTMTANITECKEIIAELEIRKSVLRAGDSMLPHINAAIEAHKDIIKRHIDNIIALQMMAQ